MKITMTLIMGMLMDGGEKKKPEKHRDRGDKDDDGEDDDDEEEAEDLSSIETEVTNMMR